MLTKIIQLLKSNKSGFSEPEYISYGTKIDLDVDWRKIKSATVWLDDLNPRNVRLIVTHLNQIDGISHFVDFNNLGASEQFLELVNTIK